MADALQDSVVSLRTRGDRERPSNLPLARLVAGDGVDERHQRDTVLREIEVLIGRVPE